MRSQVTILLVFVAFAAAGYYSPYKYPSYPWDTDDAVYKFTRMFPLKAFDVDPDDLGVLGRANGPMDEGFFDFLNDDEAVQADIAARIPEGDSTTREAGYTFLGQFADHDITLDATSVLGVRNNVNNLVNADTPYFDLSNVYGKRWGMLSEDVAHSVDKIKFSIGRGPFLPDPTDVGCPIDYRRNEDASAVVPELRDDENVGVANTHLIFMAFHNAAVDLLRENNPTWDDTTVFEETRKYTRYHWQWIVRNEHMPEFINPTLVKKVATGGNRVLSCRKDRPFAMPVEFSAGAYRWGHSAVRPRYKFNDVFEPVTFPAFAQDEVSSTTLRGGRPIIIPWVMGWNHFFEHPDAGQTDENGNVISSPQMGRKIDTKLAHGLLNFLFPDFSLASTNLRRGFALGLPSGQAVATFMQSRGCAESKIYKNEEIGLTKDIWKYDEAPLWYYCLAEAEKMNGGDYLDGTCGRLAAEVFLGLLKCDPLSYYNQETNWSPAKSPLKKADGSNIETVLDMVEFAGMFKEFRIADLIAMFAAQQAANEAEAQAAAGGDPAAE